MSLLRGFAKIYLRNNNHNLISWTKYNKSVNSMKARSKKKVEAGIKKSKDKSNQKKANHGLTYQEIKARDLEKIKAKQQAFQDKQKLQQDTNGNETKKK